MRVRLIALPFHIGTDYPRDDTGPARLLSAGLGEALVADGHDTATVVVEPPALSGDPVADARALVAAVAAAVRDAVAAGAFPVVASGNCLSCLGALAALGPRGGLLWCDAHGDFNTPETSPSGMLNGMPLAIASGRCYPEILRETGAARVPPRRVLVAGLREPDAAELDAMEAHGVGLLWAREVRARGKEAMAAPFSRLARECDELYIHLDIDGIDPVDAPGVAYATEGGLGGDDVGAMIEAAGDRFELAALGVAEFDPHFDQDGRTARLVVDLVRAAIGVAARRFRR